MSKVKRSEAMIAWQKAVFQYREMFKNVSPMAEVQHLEKMVKQAEVQIKAVAINDKPRRKAERKSEKKKAVARKVETKRQEDQTAILIRKEQRRKASAERERLRIVEEQKDTRRFKTREIDTQQLVPLRLDKNTVIFIKPGVDPEEVKEKFRTRNDPKEPKHQKKQTGGDGIHWYE